MVELLRCGVRVFEVGKRVTGGGGGCADGEVRVVVYATAAVPGHLQAGTEMELGVLEPQLEQSLSLPLHQLLSLGSAGLLIDWCTLLPLLLLLMGRQGREREYEGERGERGEREERQGI